MDKPDLAPAPSQWTRIDSYLGGLARRRTTRRARAYAERTEPEAPSLVLSTLPFAALIAVLGMLIIVFAVAAWPPAQPRFEKAEEASRGQGTAAPGWFDEAKKDMR